MFAIQLSIQQLSDKQCIKQFNKFASKYKKQYYNEQQRQTAKINFCKNYEKYLQLKDSPKYQNIQLGINEHFDLPKLGNTYTNYEIETSSVQQQLLDESNQRIRQLQQNANGIDDKYYSATDYNRGNSIALDNCNQVPNFAGQNTIISDEQIQQYIIPESQIPNSVDIREWGLMNSIENQGSCGSCWAFTTRLVVDSLVLHDIIYWREIYNESSLVQGWTSSNYRSSVQFILNNSYGNNYQCGGGNFINAATDVAYGYVPGIELNSKVPYVSFSSDDVKPNRAPERIELITEEFKKYQLSPVHYFNSHTDCPAILYGVIATDKQKGFGVETAKVNMIKRLLASGVALSARMHTEGSQNSDDTMAFQMYSKGILSDAQCKTLSSNHQIALIGYGHKDSIPVWVYANSWGTTFGYQGSFYVKIGSNYLCTELDVYTMLPRFRGKDQELEDTQKPFNETNAYQQMKSKNILKNINENKIVRGINGLDDYDQDGRPIQYKKNIGAGFYVICIWIAFALRCMCCPLKKQIKEPQYLSLEKTEVENYDFFQPKTMQVKM